MPEWRDLPRQQAGGFVSGATNSSTSGVAFRFFKDAALRRYNAHPILFPETSVRIPILLFFALLTIRFAVAQNQSQDATPDSAKQTASASEQTASKKDKKPATPANVPTPEKP